MPQFYEHSANLLNGDAQPMAGFRGKVVLLVNVASKCGHTPQYAGLETLWRTYRNRGLVLLGFPCNQFGDQEPGSAAEIQAFCSTSYDVSFPLFAKVEVNGSGTHPLWALLKSVAPNADGSTEIGWNFTKFLVDREGRVVSRTPSEIQPEAMVPAIERLL